MNKRIYIFICMIVAFCCCFSISSNLKNNNVYADNQEVYFSVVGQASEEVGADVVKVFVTVENKSENAKECKDKVFSSYEQNVQKLIEFGVGEDTIITQSFYMFPRCNFSNEDLNDCYQAELRYCFVVTELNKLDEIIDVVIADGTSIIRNVCYEVSNQEEIYNKVLAQAVENAKEKAKILTGNDDVSVIKIHEQSAYIDQTMLKSGNVGESGKVTISAVVKAYFKK